MVIGDPAILAIESHITHAYERKSLRALGFFVIHIGGRVYGVRSADATMLACSFDAVGERIEGRGTHIAPFAAETNASALALAFRRGVYSNDYENDQFLGLAQPEFSKLFYSNNLIWAPDGDAAFDDSSYVLQFDVSGQVRVVAWKLDTCGRPEMPSIRDIWLQEEQFYSILEDWHTQFDAEWDVAVKIAMN